MIRDPPSPGRDPIPPAAVEARGAPRSGDELPDGSVAIGAQLQKLLNLTSNYEKNEINPDSMQSAR